MKKLIIAAATLLIANTAHANQPEFNLVEVEITPTTEVQKPIVMAKDVRFANYELENFSCCGGK